MIHIGLGKTASTTLQNYVFPKLTEVVPNLSYNDPRVEELCIREYRLGLNKGEENLLGSLLAKNEHNLISYEGLINWSPNLWEHSADRLLSLFGREANIVIVVRDTNSYLTSLYQQKIQEGNIVSPQDYFISHARFKKLISLGAIRSLDCIDPNLFSLEKLYNMYSVRFDKVYFVPVNKVYEFTFLKEAFNITENDIKILMHSFLNAPRMNRSYSKLAMKLTFYKENILNSFGIRAIGSNDKYALGMIKDTIDVDVQLKYSELRMHEIIQQFPSRFFRKFVVFFTWRHLMQRIVDRVVSYKKYKLPDSVLKDFETIKSKNEKFLSELHRN